MTAAVAELVGSQAPRLSNYPTFFTSLADDATDFLESVGYSLLPWQKSFLDHSFGLGSDGLWSARSVLLIVSRQQGKALACDTDVLTANRGWVTMGDVRVGDFVFGPDGGEREVTFVSDVMLGRDCYRVSTTDGRSVVADGDHLWTVSDRRRGRSRGGVRWFENRTLTTREMLDEGLSRYASGGRTTSTGGKRYATNEYWFRLPVQGALELPKVDDLPVDPYLFGAWLGDGSSTTSSLYCHSDDVAHWVSAVFDAGFIPTVRDQLTSKVIGITCEVGAGRQLRSFGGKMKALGVWGNKRIPDCYLLAGDVQREALLQGLLDTDGHCTKAGQVEFCSTNLGLAEGVLFLARSLGWRAVLCEGRAVLNGVDHGPKYRVHWTPKQSDRYVPFRMARKAAMVGATDGGKGRDVVSISSIVSVDSVPVRCIKVDAEDGLFLAGRDLIVTHNTQLIEMRELVGLFLLNERIFHTSQQAKTNTQAWLSLTSKIDSIPDLAEEFLPHKNGGEEVSVRMRSGGFVRYIARSPNSGRGFTEMDLVVYDEAYALSDPELGALNPTQSASRNPQTWYTSSAGTSSSEVLSRLREAGMAGVDPSLLYGEWSLPEGSDPTDRSLWPVAKPSLGSPFCSWRNLESDFLALSVPDFAREHLGMWDDPAMNSVIPFDAWDACTVEFEGVSPIVGDRVVCVDVGPQLEWGSIVGAGLDAEFRTHVEVVKNDVGVDWVLPTFKRMSVSQNRPVAVCVQAGSRASMFGPDLEQLGFKVVYFSQQEVARATSRFESDVFERALTHFDDPVLKSGLGGADKFSIGDPARGAWGWLRRSTSVDITGIVAASYANHLLTLVSVEQTLNAPKRYRMARRSR